MPFSGFNLQVKEADFQLVTDLNVKKAIASSKPNGKVVPGIIPMRVLKRCANYLLQPLATLFTIIFAVGVILNFLKFGTVIPPYKGKGSRKSGDSFRPISILPPLTKIFESVLYEKLIPYIEPNLCDEQHGFLVGRSCHTALTLFTQDVFEGIDKQNGKVGAVFIDLRKAFCSINKHLLLHKLALKFSLPPYLVKLLDSYLSDRTFRLKFGDFSSKEFSDVNSVPQGSSLGPLLFSAFINDISRVIDIPFLLYADDPVIYFQNQDLTVITQKLNEALQRIHEWSLDNLISVNTDKTELISLI